MGYIDDYQLLATIGLKNDNMPYILDIASPPQHFVTGETIQRSNFLHSILLSLISRMNTDILKFILIDLNDNDLRLYNDEPHLLYPIITDIQNAKNSLVWLLHEMEKRYELMAQLGVRNIIRYNNFINDTSHELSDYTIMPFIVVIIDSFDKLIASDTELIEDIVVRLLQLCRAVGIHLILSSQYCAKNIFTPLIKCNISSRFAFFNNNKEFDYFFEDKCFPELKNDDEFLLYDGHKFCSLKCFKFSYDCLINIIEFFKKSHSPSYDPSIIQCSYNDIINETYNDAVIYLRKRIFDSVTEELKNEFNIDYIAARAIVRKLEHDGFLGDLCHLARDRN